jgi:large subunit ribosomal protein L24
MHVKKGDKVIVIAGKEKGKTAVIIRAIPTLDKVVLEGLNMVKKHTRPTKAGVKGGIISIPQPIHVSNVKLAEKVKKAPSAKVEKVAKKKAVKKGE